VVLASCVPRLAVPRLLLSDAPLSGLSTRCGMEVMDPPVWAERSLFYPGPGVSTIHAVLVGEYFQLFPFFSGDFLGCAARGVLRGDGSRSVPSAKVIGSRDLASTSMVHHFFSGACLKQTL
jgi:hypothetical protein